MTEAAAQDTAPAVPMTRELWREVETSLSYPYGSVKLRCDGFELVLRTLPQKALRLAIAPYVNGHFKGEWLQTDCEERRRFLRLSKRALFSKREQASLAQCYRGEPRAVIKAARERYAKMIESYHWMWTSFAPLKRHLIANNKVIEFVSKDAL